MVGKTLTHCYPGSVRVLADLNISTGAADHFVSIYAGLAFLMGTEASVCAFIFPLLCFAFFNNIEDRQTD